MFAIRRRIRLSVVVGLVAILASAMTLWAVGRRALTPTEQSCAGSWSFMSPDLTQTRVVYTFGKDGRVSEEHYYLTSATPNIPRLKMHGNWRVESDNRLVIESGGLRDEAPRWFRSTLGNVQYEHRMLHHFYRVKSVGPDSLAVQANSVKSGNQIVMTRYSDTQHP